MDIQSYDQAISKVIPGTFVPDIAPSAPRTEPIPSDTNTASSAGGASFADTLKQYLGDVNDKMATSDQLQKDLATGKTGDFDKVVTTTEEANLAFSFTVAMRNKLMDAYREIQQIQA